MATEPSYILDGEKVSREEYESRKATLTKAFEPFLAYVTIGNSDNKLTQHEWYSFVVETRQVVRNYAEAIHGEWFSAPDSPYQNANFGFQLHPKNATTVKNLLGDIAATYKQDSIVFARAEADFVCATEEADTP